MKLLICDDDILTVDVIESHLDRAQKSSISYKKLEKIFDIPER